MLKLTSGVTHMDYEDNGFPFVSMSKKRPKYFMAQTIVMSVRHCIVSFHVRQLSKIKSNYHDYIVTPADTGVFCLRMLIICKYTQTRAHAHRRIHLKYTHYTHTLITHMAYHILVRLQG